MPAAARADYEPLDPSEPPPSPSLEIALSGVLADISELDCGLTTTTEDKLKANWSDNEDADTSTALRSATLPYEDAAEAKRSRRTAIERKSRLRRQDTLKRMREEAKHLERVYADMPRKRDTDTGSSHGLVQWQGCSNLTPMDELQQKYSELTEHWRRTRPLFEVLRLDRSRTGSILIYHDLACRRVAAWVHREAGPLD